MDEVGGGRRGRRWRRAAGAVATLAVAVAGPTELLQRWTGLDAPPAIALALVGLAAALWISEAVPLFVTSFVILVLELAWLRPALLASGREVEASRFLAPFFSNVVLLFLGGFVLSAAFRRYLVDRRIAGWVLAKTGGAPRRLLAAVIAVAGFLSMWMSNTATAAMMLGLTAPLLAQVEESDPFRRALPLGIAFGANFGGLGTPIGTPPNAIVLEAMTAHGHAPRFATWLAMSFPLLALFLVVTWLVLDRLYPARVARVALADAPGAGSTSESRVVVIVAVLTALLWLTSGLHPLETGTVALFPVILFFGGRLLDREDFLQIPWDVLVLAGGGLSLGVAVEASGLADVAVAEIPVDALGALGLAAVIALVAAVMTTFMSNTATANLLVPVVAGLAGAPTASLLVLVAYACSCTMILPVSTPPNSMVFGTGHITTRDLVRASVAVSAFALVVTVLVGPWWWGLFGVR